MTATGPIPFAFYGGSGELDFNWEELRRLDRTLDGFDVRHHVTEWDGGHTWPDAAGFARALEWLDTDAVGLGLQVRAHDELSRRFEAGLARAAELEAAGRWTAAWREYTTLVGSFDGLLDTDRARVAAERLAGSELWERERASIDRALEHRRDFDRELGAWLQDVRRNEDARSVRGGIDRLDVEELQETARSSEDRIERQAARRMLESLHVYAVFYETEARIAVEAWEVALAFLDLAEVIHPDDPRVAFARARIYARDDRFDEAFEALDVLEASGLLTPGALTESEDLAPLRGDARYVALLERLAGEPAPLTR